jgi:hypothetical protein
MSTSAEQLEGSGTLRPEAGDPGTAVTFTFNIRRAQLQSKPGLPPRPGRAQGRGSIVATDGRALLEGTYRLDTSNGQRMRVQKLGREWHILSAP